MSLFKPGAVIPKGYTITITSWENDGDDYDTVYIKGLPTKDIVNEVLLVLKWFGHAYEDMGNDNIQHEEILDRLWYCIEGGTITKEFFDRFMGDVEFPVIGDDQAHDDWLDRVAQSGGYDEVEDMVRGFCSYPMQYDHDFARMVEKAQIHYFAEDFKVPEMPPAIAEFDAGWGNRNRNKEWKL